MALQRKMQLEVTPGQIGIKSSFIKEYNPLILMSYLLSSQKGNDELVHTPFEGYSLMLDYYWNAKGGRHERASLILSSAGGIVRITDIPVVFKTPEAEGLFEFLWEEALAMRDFFWEKMGLDLDIKCRYCRGSPVERDFGELGGFPNPL